MSDYEMQDWCDVEIVNGPSRKRKETEAIEWAIQKMEEDAMGGGDKAKALAWVTRQLEKEELQSRLIYHTVGPDNAVYGHSSVVNSAWEKITVGSVTQVVVANGIIYGLDFSHTVCRWFRDCWRKITPESFDVHHHFAIVGEDVYGLGKRHAIWKSSINGAAWVQVTKGNMIDFAISEGIIYGVGTNKCVYTQTLGGKQQWHKETAGAVTQVQVANKVIYGLGLRSKCIHIWTGKKWEHVSNTPMASFDILGGFIYGMGLDKAVYKYPLPSSRWRKCTSVFPTTDKLKPSEVVASIGAML